MSWLLFTLSPIVATTVAYFNPALGVQVGAAGLCAGAGMIAIGSAVERQAALRPAVVPVRRSARVGLVAPTAR